MASARNPKAVPDVNELVARANAALQREGVVKMAGLGPPTVRAQVVQRLRDMGFEATKSFVRRPLAEQLAHALADGAYIPLDKGIGSFARGATAAEAKKAALALAHEGTAQRVVRGKIEVLVPRSAPVLSRDELAAARRVLDTLSKALAKTGKQKGLTLLRADLAEALEEVMPEQGPAPDARNDRSRVGDVFSRVLGAVDALRDEKLGLSFIPRIVAHLRPHVAAEAVKAALLDAAQRGVLELRPEGGLGRLSRDELEMCLPGPQGTRLSWARRVEESLS